MHVVMLAFPNMTQLDLTGPFEVFTRFKELKVDLVWKTTEVVRDNSGLRLVPSVAFADCPQADILFVPGGPGQLALMDDAETLGFLRAQAVQARYVTSVCTSSATRPPVTGCRCRSLAISALSQCSSAS
jgi:cyclohexyl-isocyanide hydratase